MSTQLTAYYAMLKKYREALVEAENFRQAAKSLYYNVPDEEYEGIAWEDYKDIH